MGADRRLAASRPITVRIIETTRSTEVEKEVPRRVEDLDAVMGSITNDDSARAVHSYTEWSGQLAVASALAPEPEEGTSRGVEDLESVISGVGDDDPVGTVHCYPKWSELAVTIAAAADLEEEVARSVEDLESVICTVGDDDSIGAVHRQVSAVVGSAAAGCMSNTRKRVLCTAVMLRRPGAPPVAFLSVRT